MRQEERKVARENCHLVCSRGSRLGCTLFLSIFQLQVSPAPQSGPASQLAQHAPAPALAQWTARHCATSSLSCRPGRAATARLRRHNRPAPGRDIVVTV